MANGSEFDKYSFSENDGFDEQVRKVQAFLKDPGFVEFGNKNCIYSAVVDGQRKYSREGIEAIKLEEEKVDKENLDLSGDGINLRFAKGIAEATENLTQPGVYIIQGHDAYGIMDSIMFDISEMNLPTEAIGDFLELSIAGALYMNFKKSFVDYQTDISMSGQGFMAETYSINIQFRPIPKNIEDVR